MGRYIGVGEFFGINSSLLSSLQIVLLVILVICYLYLRKRLVKSGVLWRREVVSTFEGQIGLVIGLVIFATLVISFTARYVYQPVELTAINSEGSTTYSSSDVSDFSAVVDGKGKYNVSIEMKDGNTVSMLLTSSEYSILEKQYLNSKGADISQIISGKYISRIVILLILVNILYLVICPRTEEVDTSS